MSELETKLRETARQLLADEQVDVIIGYAPGTLPLRTKPCFVYDPDGRITNPQGIENDLGREEDGLTVYVHIVPKGY